MPITCNGLQARLAKAAEREAEIQAALQAKAADQEAARDTKRRKRKTPQELLQYLNVEDLLPYQLRPVEQYVPRSYNLERQVYGLLDHLFVRYPVPETLYRECLWDPDRMPLKGAAPGASAALHAAAQAQFHHRTQVTLGPHFKCTWWHMQDLYREWFRVLAQGKSFPKAVKGILTAKEAAAFLSAPLLAQTHDAVWWAKLQVAGIPKELRSKLIDRVLTFFFFDDPGDRLQSFIRFMARYHDQFEEETLSQVLDYTLHQLRTHRQFTFQGRTPASVIELTNQYHLEIQKAKLGTFVEWKGIGPAYWQEVNPGGQVWVEVVELRNNRELLNEGRKMRHCVYGYVRTCAAGYTSVFSLRRYHCHRVGDDPDTGEALYDRGNEFSRATLEVRNGGVYQFRGLLNALPNGEEFAAIHRWCGVTGYRPPNKRGTGW
jgi:hypothetical protein